MATTSCRLAVSVLTLRRNTQETVDRISSTVSVWLPHLDHGDELSPPCGQRADVAQKHSPQCQHCRLLLLRQPHPRHHLRWENGSLGIHCILELVSSTASFHSCVNSARATTYDANIEAVAHQFLNEYIPQRQDRVLLLPRQPRTRHHLQSEIQTSRNCFCWCFFMKCAGSCAGLCPAAPAPAWHRPP